jgi:hypothetical protein
MSPQMCKDIALKENACLGCFRKGHKYKDCRVRERLKCAKCQSPNHHTFLHENKKGSYVTISSNQSESTAVNDVITATDSSESEPEVEVKGATALQARLGKDATIMPIIKVRMKGKNGKKLEVNAMLDQCSDQTFIRSDVIKALQLDGPTVPNRS